jgi:hypothetical protein
MMCADMRAPAWSWIVIVALAGCTAGTILDEINSGGDNGEPGAPDAAPHPRADAPSGPVPDAAVPDAAPPGDPPPTFGVTALTRDDILSIAKASVGYTYWWGHAMLGGTQAGTCTGSCPSCTHTGPDGADCSGFVGKAWMLPEALPIVDNDDHPFSTYGFSHSTTHWTPIARGEVLAGDAMVYNIDGSGHIFLYEKDDPWGQMWTYEARGCAYGIVHNIRTAGSQFNAIRRDGLE